MRKNDILAYDELCGLFYDATEKYASEQEVDFFASCIEKNPGRVLEAMSGSGRLQVPLIRRGYVVDGVDISDAMLARCRQRCAEFGLTPELYEQPLEKMSLPHRYSTVIIAVGSLQLITDRNLVLQALKNIKAHMLPSGHLFIDIFVPDKTLDEHAVLIARLDEQTIIRLTKRHVFNMQQRLASTFCLYELIVGGIVTKQENALIEVVWRSDEQWQELLSEAGFEMLHVYDQNFKQFETSRVIHARVL